MKTFSFSTLSMLRQKTVLKKTKRGLLFPLRDSLLELCAALILKALICFCSHCVFKPSFRLHPRSTPPKPLVRKTAIPHLDPCRKVSCLHIRGLYLPTQQRPAWLFSSSLSLTQSFHRHSVFCLGFQTHFTHLCLGLY